MTSVVREPVLVPKTRLDVGRACDRGMTCAARISDRVSFSGHNGCVLLALSSMCLPYDGVHDWTSVLPGTCCE